jgi:hypothetical protein
MSKTLDEIRKKLQALDSRKGGQSGNFGGDKLTYAHWNIAEGTSAILRLVPDANPDNTFFWAERQLIKLPFPGIKGQDENKPVLVQIPCIEMWDGKMTCPILNEVRPWWKDKSLEETARKYWVKRTYYMQGFVKQDPLNETDAPENPIRKFIIGPQIFAIIKAALMDPDMVYSPVDYVNGTDFIVSKTSKGGYADYGTSKWARKESSLTEEMQAALAQFPPVDLSTYLPKRPTPEQLAIQFEMFQASLEGELYDPAQWSQHYKPFGFDSGPTSDDADGGEGKRATRPTYSRPVAPVTAPTGIQLGVKKSLSASIDEVETVGGPVDNTPPFDADEPETATATVTPAAAGKSPQEILAMLRNRNK